ncbi:MAG: hypothetical protein ACKVQU_00810 [Burkholderiales bacterium]
MNTPIEEKMPRAYGRSRLVAASLCACGVFACTSMNDSTDATRVSGTVLGGTTGNVLSFVVDEDGRSASVLGAFAGAGVGSWRGATSDDQLRHAQATATEIANLAARGRYPYEQPKLYARIEEGERRIARFEKLEVHFPLEAVQAGVAEATVVLQRLGRLAGAEGLKVTIDAPSEHTQRVMQRSFLEGVRVGEPTIVLRIHHEPRVMVERIR